MDLYNHYIMRTCGEKKFQAKSNFERCTFALFDFLKKDKPNLWGEKSSLERNNIMSKVMEKIFEATINGIYLNPEKVALLASDYLLEIKFISSIKPAEIISLAKTISRAIRNNPNLRDLKNQQCSRTCPFRL